VFEAFLLYPNGRGFLSRNLSFATNPTLNTETFFSEILKTPQPLGKESLALG